MSYSIYRSIRQLYLNLGPALAPVARLGSSLSCLRTTDFANISL
jgi:hypothetical protein